MNDIENYNSVIEHYFGKGAATLDATRNTSNHVIGALNNAQFAPFTRAFHKRLERLSVRYRENANQRHLLRVVNDVGRERNWEGAYAEVVAFDFLNSDKDWLTQPVSLSRTVPASETLAIDLGMTNVNFDGYYDDFNVCFDVKTLSDKSRDILDGLISQVIKDLGLSAVTIMPEYRLDLDFALFEKNRTALYKELAGTIDARAKPRYVRSVVLPELSYRILWGAGTLTTAGSYDPYEHAANHHTLLFKHAKKFSKKSPCLIVFVAFPWFSESVLSGIGRSEVFYRAFCRRFFCQYAKDNRKAKEVLGGFRGEVTMADVTSKLSGVLFLEVGSIESTEPDEQMVKASAYLNPNATQKFSHTFIQYLYVLDVVVDDFIHDNY